MKNRVPVLFRGLLVGGFLFLLLFLTVTQIMPQIHDRVDSLVTEALMAHFNGKRATGPDPAMLNSDLYERGVMKVRVGNGREAVVHYWKPRSEDASEVRFVEQGNRVFVYTVPKNQKTR